MGLSQQKLNEKKEYFIFKIKKKIIITAKSNSIK
jgi:hypothetical protein